MPAPRLEEAELGVPSRSRVGIAASKPGELGAGGQPGEQRHRTEPAVGQRRFGRLGDLEDSRFRHHRACARLAVTDRGPRRASPYGPPRRPPTQSRCVRSASATSTRPRAGGFPSSTSTNARSTAIRGSTVGSAICSPSRRAHAQRGLGEVDRHVVGGDLQAGCGRGRQDAGRRHGADRARGEAEHRRSRVGDVPARRGGRGAAADDRHYLAGQHPHEVEQVGRLLDDSARRTCSPGSTSGAEGSSPTSGRRRAGRCDPGALRKPGPPCRGAASGSPWRWAARGRHSSGDLLGHRQTSGQRLLDEERQFGADQSGLRIAVRERRDAEPHRVEAPSDQPLQTADRWNAEPCGQRRSDDVVRVVYADDLDIVERGERAGVPCTNASGSDQSHPHTHPEHGAGSPNRPPVHHGSDAACTRSVQAVSARGEPAVGLSPNVTARAGPDTHCALGVPRGNYRCRPAPPDERTLDAP